MASAVDGGVVAFRCDDLRKSFNGVSAIDGVTLEVRRGNISAIIGPNGAGKTTLLNILGGFLRPDAGRCSVDGHDISRLGPHGIACIGVARTFQDLRLIRSVSVFDNVMMARPNQRGERLLPALTGIGVAREELRNATRVMELLDLVGLEHKSSAAADDLSYGQQKLLTLAVCLATEANLLILDEPVAGVAPQMVKQISALLRQLRDSGKTIIVVEHDIEVVRLIADSVILMDRGKVVADGPAREVLECREIVEVYLG